MSKDPPDNDFEIHIDPDCMSPAMEESNHIDNLEDHSTETVVPVENAEEVVPSVEIPQDLDETSAVLENADAQEPDPVAEAEQTTVEEAADESAPLDSTHQEAEEAPEEPESSPEEGRVSDIDHDSAQTSILHPTQEDDHSEVAPSEHTASELSEYESSIADTDLASEDLASILESASLDRRHSLRTEALIQAAARAVVSMRQDHEEDHDHEHHDGDESMVSYTTNADEGADETLQLDTEDALPSRPESSASSPTERSSDGDAAESRSHQGTEDDVFSDRSPRSSINSADEHFDDDALEQMTEKGDQSPQLRSRVVSGVSASGVSASGESAISDFSRLSRYEKEDFVPTSRSNRPAFRSPSSVRAIQMSSPTPSVYSKSSPKPAKRPAALPTISRLGSPAVSAQYSPPKRRSTRFKQQEQPLVLLHVTLLPLRWSYSEIFNHFESKKSPPVAFTGEGIKNLRGAWRQLQDRLGDLVLDRGILLPHPQNDYEVLEERLLEALELPLRRRARILECGHYLGPASEMTVKDDTDSDSEEFSDYEEYEARQKPEKRHWCKTCKGDIKYEELGSDRIFRVKVYASNGLMSAGAWEACWKEMERVDIEVEPIIDSGLQSELSKLSSILEQEQQQQLQAEKEQEAADAQRMLFEEEQRLALEEERHRLETQRQELEEERRRTLEDVRKELEEQRRVMEQEQRERLEEERRQKFEEERQQLDAQRQQFEEQRLELDMQRKIVEEEQRQYLEEARRQELEEEQRQIEQQRQQLEEARQQFEEERRQRLEEEELRRLQREEDEAKQMSASRSMSRTSYVEDEQDELASPSTEVGATTDLDGRRRDSDRLREIYGEQGRNPSENAIGNSSPAIHIHVGDSARQREEEQNSRQLATIPAPVPSPVPRDNAMQVAPVQEESRQAQSFMTPSAAQPSPEQAYQQSQPPRKALETASLPELLGETIRVLLQDPKNVAIAILVVLIAMLAGQFARQEERGLELYKPQHYQSHHHQLDGREPVGQVIMNTPVQVTHTQVQQHTVTQQVTQQIETVYKTVTAEAAPPPPPPRKPLNTPEVEIVYETVTRVAQQPEAPTRVVETVYHTVTAAAADASEFPLSAAGAAFPSVVDLQVEVAEDDPSSSTLIDAGFVVDPPFPTPSSPTDLNSNAETLKTDPKSEEEEAARGDDTQDMAPLPSAVDTTKETLDRMPQLEDDVATSTEEVSESVTGQVENPTIEQSVEESVAAATETPAETVTETLVEMVTRTRAASTTTSTSAVISSEATTIPDSSASDDEASLAGDTTSSSVASVTEIDTASEVLPTTTSTTIMTTYTETVKVTSTVEVDALETTADA